MHLGIGSINHCSLLLSVQGQLYLPALLCRSSLVHTSPCMCRVGAEGAAAAATWRPWQWGLELTRAAQPGDVLATMPARAALGMHPVDLAVSLAALRVQDPLHSALTQPGRGRGSAARDGGDRARSRDARSRFVAGEGHAEGMLGWQARVLAAHMAAAVPEPLAALAASRPSACTANEAAALRDALQGAYLLLQLACEAAQRAALKSATSLAC